MNLEMTKKSFNTFKDCISLMKTINEELTLHIDKEGIQTRGMDPSHVAMIEALIKPELFDKFEVPEEKFMITANLLEFGKFLDRVARDESIKISYEEKEMKLIIQARKGGRRRRFSIPLLEPFEDEMPEPKIFFNSEARILTQSIDTAIKDADLVSEHLQIILDKDMVKISANGDMGSTQNEFDKDSDELLQLKVQENSTATYTLSYVKDIIGQVKNIADVIAISLSTDLPLKIEAESNNPNLEVVLFLAPCIGV